jgi:hypothetical protein
MSKSKVSIKWQTIVFSFNYDKLSEIKLFAESKGAEFYAIKTHRYEDDTLIPPAELIETNYQFNDEFLGNNPIDMLPQCEEEKVITCDGYFLPCDWIRNPHTFYKSDLWKNKQDWLDNLTIDKINLDQGLEAVKKWKDLVIEKGKNGSPSLDNICKMRCRTGCYDPDNMRDHEGSYKPSEVTEVQWIHNKSS